MKHRLALRLLVLGVLLVWNQHASAYCKVCFEPGLNLETGCNNNSFLFGLFGIKWDPDVGFPGDPYSKHGGNKGGYPPAQASYFSEGPGGPVLSIGPDHQTPYQPPIPQVPPMPQDPRMPTQPPSPTQLPMPTQVPHQPMPPGQPYGPQAWGYPQAPAPAATGYQTQPVGYYYYPYPQATPQYYPYPASYNGYNYGYGYGYGYGW